MGRKNSAFTLIELLIVISVVALLAILVVNALRGNILKGNDARRKSDLNRIKIALEEYEKDHNCYPPPEEMVNCGTDSSIAIHPYLNDVPCDPVTKQAYFYEPDPGSPVCVNWFRVYAKLQNSSDKDYLAGIGENYEYSYYAKSDNAPLLVASGSTPAPTPQGSSGPTSTPPPTIRYWGCIDSICQPAPTGPSGLPLCSPVFDNAQCNGNPCSGSGAPVCVSQVPPPANPIQ